MASVRARMIGLSGIGDRMVAKVTARASAAGKSAIESTARRAHEAIRRDVDRIFTGSSSRTGRGRRVSNAVRLKIYKMDSRGRAGWRAQIWSKFGSGRGADFEDYFGPYLTGKDLRARDGGLLYIPLQGSRRARRKFRGSVALDKTLDFVPLGGGRYLLIKRAIKRQRAGQAIGTAVALLVPVVKIKRRLRAREIALQETRRLGAVMKQAWGREKVSKGP